jgi:hypothetical protein
MSILDPTSDLRSQRFYHGTRADLKSGDLIEPCDSTYVYLTPDLDGAIWEAELSAGDGPGRVYIVEPAGEIEGIPEPVHPNSRSHPTMSCRSSQPLRVIGEVTEWLFYHGTRADLKLGGLIKPGHTANFGKELRTANHIYLTRTLDAAMWGAELAAGDGPGRIYIVEPTGPIEEDPNLTNKKFRGNPTKSYRSRQPLRVTDEITNWPGHSPEALQAMKDGLKRLEQLGLQSIND